NAAIISTAQQPFTSKLISTNYSMFRYCLVWEKSKATGYLNSKKMPLKAHEDIVVFYKKLCTYNPQMTDGEPYDKGIAVRDAVQYGKQTKAVHVKNTEGTRYPRSVLYFKTAEDEGKLHPTQKPIALYEYLVRTYSNEGDMILDPCMGSGTTGIASLNTGRKFIGIEKDENYYITAEKRLMTVEKSSQAICNPLTELLY
ncbi:MAG: site-specific DNA-methyltransferase, partial [Pseudomonadota bacterium]|nr:site-specific DNA-methyltransferase [Pseudomonadota bacterium]